MRRAPSSCSSLRAHRHRLVVRPGGPRLRAQETTSCIHVAQPGGTLRLATLLFILAGAARLPASTATVPKLEKLYQDWSKTVRSDSDGPRVHEDGSKTRRVESSRPQTLPKVMSDGSDGKVYVGGPPRTRDDGSAAGLASQLASAVSNVPSPTLSPGARYLFYDILEHEQLNKQRKGFMYALKVAQSLDRELVLHRFRVRKYEKGAQQKLSQGRSPLFTHTFFPWRKYFNMSRLAAGLPRVHEFDVLMHALGAGGGGNESAIGSGVFSFDHVLYMNSLLEGRRDMVGIHDRQVK